MSTVTGRRSFVAIRCNSMGRICLVTDQLQMHLFTTDSNDFSQVLHQFHAHRIQRCVSRSIVHEGNDQSNVRQGCWTFSTSLSPARCERVQSWRIERKGWWIGRVSLHSAQLSHDEILFLLSIAIGRLPCCDDLLRNELLPIVNTLIPIDQNRDEHSRRGCSEQRTETGQNSTDATDGVHVAIPRDTHTHTHEHGQRGRDVSLTQLWSRSQFPSRSLGESNRTEDSLQLVQQRGWPLQREMRST